MRGICLEAGKRKSRSNERSVFAGESLNLHRGLRLTRTISTVRTQQDLMPYQANQLKQSHHEQSEGEAARYSQRT